MNFAKGILVKKGAILCFWREGMALFWGVGVKKFGANRKAVVYGVVCCARGGCDFLIFLV